MQICARSFGYVHIKHQNVISDFDRGMIVGATWADLSMSRTAEPAFLHPTVSIIY